MSVQGGGAVCSQGWNEPGFDFTRFREAGKKKQKIRIHDLGLFSVNDLICKQRLNSIVLKYGMITDNGSYFRLPHEPFY